MTARAITPEHQEIQSLKQQVQQLKKGEGYIKKGVRALHPGGQCPFEIIQQVKGAHVNFSITELCQEFDVCRSSYYYWLKHNTHLSPERESLQKEVLDIHEEFYQTYGSRRMVIKMNHRGHSVGRYLARQLMREVDAVAVRPIKKHKYPTQDDESNIASNVSDRDFEAVEINKKWVGDITYLWTIQGWMYLAVVLDSCSRAVVGWATSDTPDTDLILCALNQAVARRQPDKGLIFHSDQGCQYTSHRFQNKLSDLRIQASMSRRGQC